MGYQLLSHLFYSDPESYDTMYALRLNGESTYKFNFAIDEHPCFMVITPEILTLVNDILSMDNIVTDLNYDLPVLAFNKYTKKCLIDEVLLTNEIEGVVSTRQEINTILETLESGKKKDRLYGLVRKYNMLAKRDKIPLEASHDIRDLYNDLCYDEVQKESADNALDGTLFRKGSVDVLSPTQKVIHQGLYPESEIIKWMDVALTDLNNQSIIPLVRISAFHFFFGYIHPFYDGNGRTSRFISSYLLSKQLNILLPFRLSLTIKKNLNRYYKAFVETNKKRNLGDLTYFVTSFLSIILQAEKDLYDDIQDNLNTFHFFEDKIKKSNYASKTKKILNCLIINTLFGEQDLSRADIAEEADISLYSVNKGLKELEASQILVTKKNGNTNLFSVDLDHFSEQ